MNIPTPATDVRVKQTQCLLQAIQAWPDWEQIALCAQKEYDISPEQFQARLPEYQRFLALCAFYPGIGMTSELIDQLWHSHILHTILYEAFCASIIGHKVHHFPCSSYTLYGIDPPTAEDDCTTCELPTIPKTCYNKRSPEEAWEETRRSILEGSQRFAQAYTEVFGEPPNRLIWGRTSRARAEAVAV
jgi:hypothetical protein